MGRKACAEPQRLYKGALFYSKYRVSKKSFPDYKHLLQENYVEYKYIFFTITYVISQQDGAPPHWGSHVRRFWDETFPNRWNGRDGPTSWPPRSPDITTP